MHPWDIRVSIPSSGAASPEFCVQATITMVHRLYNPLCSNNHNCDLMMVCVVIWQNFIRAETLILSCSSWKTSVSSIILAHVYTTIFVSREKTEWITDRLVHIPCLEEAQVQWHKWDTMGSLLQVSYKVETRAKSLTTVSQGSPCWLSGKESACHCRRHRFILCGRKIPWKRKWQPASVFLPEKSPGQMERAGRL